MSTPSAVNCLTADTKAKLCINNTFGELAPNCSKITNKDSCEYSYGCYYNGN